jgi:mono/diheme cytochrome c family protein
VLRAITIGVLSVVLLAALKPPHTVIGGSSAKDRGAELFASKGCAFCHGPAGVGGNIGPDLQLVRQRRTRDQIVTQIRNGSKTMPNFDDKLSTDEINDLVAFLIAKRKFTTVPAKPAPVPPVSTASPESN